MEDRALKYLLDLESVIAEMEDIRTRLKGDYTAFEQDMVAIRAIERHFEIIGEAANRLAAVNPKYRLKHTRAIIGLRNIIAHSYDAVDHGILWGILVNHVPKLKKEIQRLRSGK